MRARFCLRSRRLERFGAKATFSGTPFSNSLVSAAKMGAMGVVSARFVFLAFVGLTGVIIYNALYLQETRHGAVNPVAVAAQDPGAEPAVEGAPALAPVTTDLPTLPVQVPEGLVKAVQRELTARGYQPGPTDGDLRDETRTAIATYEEDHGLIVTGSPSEDLLQHILLGASVKPSASTGSVSEQAAGSLEADSATVKAVQRVLADLGYAPGPIDGKLGESTAGAIASFQEDRKIASTGHITPEFLGEIKRVIGHDLKVETASR